MVEPGKGHRATAGRADASVSPANDLAPAYAAWADHAIGAEQDGQVDRCAAARPGLTMAS
jgi:hypothetical protein